MEKVEIYNSWSDFLDSFNQPIKGDMRRSMDYDSSGWQGTNTWDECWKYALEGWWAEADRVMQVTSLIEHDLKIDETEVNHFYNDVEGGAVDIASFIAGIPECMVNLQPVRETTFGRVVTVLVNIDAMASVHAEAITSRGVAICAFVDCLVRLNLGVDLWIESTCKGNGSTYTCLVNVKPTEDDMDLGRVMFAVANAAVVRRLMFGRLERQDEVIRRDCGVMSGGYGRSGECVMQDAVDANITLDLMRTDKDGLADPEAWIRDNLREFGLID